MFAILNVTLRKKYDNQGQYFRKFKRILPTVQVHISPFFIILHFFFSFSPSFFHRHLSSKNLGHLGKTVQALLNQVQKYVYDYNMGRMGQGNSNSSQISGSDFLSDSFKNHEWNFPGLRKNVAASPSEQQNSIEQEIKSADQDGIKEIVLLQQRTVLQVIKNIILLRLCKL